MEENQNQETQKQETPKAENEIKKQTVDTFNAAKEQMKNINLKEEAETGKGLIKKLWSKPAEAVKDIAEDKENKFFKTALLILAVWIVVVLVKQIIYYATSKYASFDFGETLKVVINPILRILALSVAIFILVKYIKKKDISLVTIITSSIIARIPIIFSSLIGMLTYISSKITNITSPINSVLSLISTIFVYLAVKALSKDEDESKAIRSFIIVEGIYYIIYFVLSFLEIYI